MIDNILNDHEFNKIMQSNTGCAIIMAGSDSDLPHIEKIIKSLDSWEIPYRTVIKSAHKQDVEETIKGLNKIGGSYALIAVAGGTDALSGQASFHSHAPVISCPPDQEKYYNGINESCLRNPPGSSNAYVARPDNVGKFIAQMYAGLNQRFNELLVKSNEDKIMKLEEKGTIIYGSHRSGN
ncbi:MAG: AIR carboxylase family protein [Nanoarchaeota archaeon]|nr:AIR carboxylase family protein [Nanoarchaeota archaeon]